MRLITFDAPSSSLRTSKFPGGAKASIGLRTMQILAIVDIENPTGALCTHLSVTTPSNSPGGGG